MSVSCILKANIGDIARVCLEPCSFDDEGRRTWLPTPKYSGFEFNFEVIDEALGWPVIGVPASDNTNYHFSKTSYKYRGYSSSYILIPTNIKTVKIIKKAK